MLKNVYGSTPTLPPETGDIIGDKNGVISTFFIFAVFFSFVNNID